MPIEVGNDVKSGVVYEWLRGRSRDNIAGLYNISTGGVTNIINEWRNNIGAYKAEDLRELSISLKKANITPIQCSIGFRVAKIMQKLGITEEQFQSFMSDVYDRCQKLELGPDQIEKYLIETINISKIVFPSQIPNYISMKKIELGELEKQIENKQETISELNKEISNLEEKQKGLIETYKISVDGINWYRDIKKELTSVGIPFDEIPVFIDCLRGIKNQGYNVDMIVTKSSELLAFSKFIDDQNEIKLKIINEMNQLKNIKKGLEDQIGIIQLKLTKNQELENIGMGFKELKIIYKTIIELSNANNINPKEAIEKFFNDLNEYDDIISFKKKVEDLKKDVATLNSQIANNRMILSAQQNIGPILHDLVRKGISEKDIIDINFILLLGETDDYNNNIRNKQSLISDLKNCRNLKLGINSLEQKQIQLTNNIKELENKKIVLEHYTNYLFLLLSNLKEIQILLKKMNIALENPKSILLYLFHISFLKDEDKDSKKDDDFSH
jgi:hypothetical protein